MNSPSRNACESGAEKPVLRLKISLGADGRSRIEERHVSFPWSLGRGYATDPGQPVMVIPQMAGAGLLADDQVSQRILVSKDAALHLVSAGAMLTYGSPGGGASISDWSVELEECAQAIVVSEPYVLLDDASLALRQTIIVPPDATFIGCEGIVCARTGNRSQWQTETIVRRPDGTHLFTDRQRAGSHVLQLQNDLRDRWSAFGTLLVIGAGSAKCVVAMESRVSTESDRVWIGCAQTRSESGLCIRIAARDGLNLRTTMMHLMNMLISELKHRDVAPCPHSFFQDDTKFS